MFQNHKTMILQSQKSCHILGQMKESFSVVGEVYFTLKIWFYSDDALR